MEVKINERASTSINQPKKQTLHVLSDYCCNASGKKEINPTESFNYDDEEDILNF